MRRVPERAGAFAGTGVPACCATARGRPVAAVEGIAAAQGSPSAKGADGGPEAKGLSGRVANLASFLLPNHLGIADPEPFVLDRSFRRRGCRLDTRGDLEDTPSGVRDVGLEVDPNPWGSAVLERVCDACTVPGNRVMVSAGCRAGRDDQRHAGSVPGARTAMVRFVGDDPQAGLALGLAGNALPAQTQHRLCQINAELVRQPDSIDIGHCTTSWTNTTNEEHCVRSSFALVVPSWCAIEP